MEQSELLKNAWEESDKTQLIGIIREAQGEDLGKVFAPEQKKIWDSAFDTEQKKEKVLICSDERIQPAPGEFKMGVAGQLILAPLDVQTKFIHDWKGKIKFVRSHSGCGAAGLAYQKLSPEEKNQYQDGDNPADEYGKLFSADLASKLGADFEHIPFSRMRGSEDFHDARMIFWSADPEFDPSELDNDFLPPHFLANGLAYGLEPEYCKEELKILSGIGLGGHGFGELFTPDNPFYVISLGKNAKEINGLAKEALKEFGDRVKFKYIKR